jgi:YHS domain-containing protein
MYRLIAILILAGIIYWAVKRALFPSQRRVGSDEEMVRDPVCGCYISKSQSFAVSYRGKKYFFCSPKCFEKYRTSNSLPKN